MIVKKKIGVISPTLRHKKRYVSFSYSNNVDEKGIGRLLSDNFLRVHGIFANIEANLMIASNDFKHKKLIVRVNKDLLDKFISSLFFLEKELGLVIVESVSSTIKSVSKTK